MSGREPAPRPFAAGPGQVHLRVISTTDLHAHLLAYDYYADAPSLGPCLARAAGVIAEARAGAANAILVDNGDFLQGSPMADYVAYERGIPRGAKHPVIAALEALGVDAATIGNHEFNYGLDFLRDAVGDAGFPIVSANIVEGALGTVPFADRTLFAPHALLERMLADSAGAVHPVRIGLIGFCPPQILNWDRHHLEGKLSVRGIVETARARVPELKSAGADIVIALSHSGITAEPASAGMENASLHLAEIEGIDAIVAGHQHRLFPGDGFASGGGIDAEAGTLHGTPATMAGALGSHVGVIDLALGRGEGGWRVERSAASLLPLPAAGDDPAPPGPLTAALAEDHDGTLAYVRRPVGRAEVPLHTYFSLLADDAATRLVNEAQTGFVTRALTGTEWEELPVLSATSPFKAGGRGGPGYYTEIPAGPVALRHVADLYPYANTLCAVLITGSQLADWLERSAAVFNRIAPGSQDTQLLAPNGVSYDFDVIHGVTYEIDLAAPARFDADGRRIDPEARRIRALRYSEAEVAPGQRFVLATNTYRAGGGGHFPGLDGLTRILTAQETSRDVVFRHIANARTVGTHPAPGWRFAPMPGTAAIYQTGPGAAQFIDEIARFRPEAAGVSEAGFALYRVAL